MTSLPPQVNSYQSLNPFSSDRTPYVTCKAGLFIYGGQRAYTFVELRCVTYIWYVRARVRLIRPDIPSGTSYLVRMSYTARHTLTYVVSRIHPPRFQEVDGGAAPYEFARHVSWRAQENRTSTKNIKLNVYIAFKNKSNRVLWEGPTPPRLQCSADPPKVPLLH